MSRLSSRRCWRATLTNAQVGPLDLANLAGRDSASTRTLARASRTSALPFWQFVDRVKSPGCVVDISSTFDFRTTSDSPQVPCFAPSPPVPTKLSTCLRNAQLRDELEPLFDESIGRVNSTVMSTRSENEFLESMLEWERAPILPISQWFEPELMLPHPGRLERAPAVARARRRRSRSCSRSTWCSTSPTTERLPALLHHLPRHSCRRRKRSSNAARRICTGTVRTSTTTRPRGCGTTRPKAERELWAAENDEPLPTRAEPPYRRQLPKAPLY